MELALLLLVDKRNGRAGRRGPGRPADAVNVVLGVVRNVEINYRADVLDVDPARHDVRSHQHVDLAVFEVEHDLFALLLLQVGVHRCDVQLHALERKSELLDLLLRGGENDRLRSRRLRKQLADDTHLLVLVADVGRLLDRLVGLRHGDIDLGRIVHDLLGQLAYLGRQSGREHDRLTLGRQLGHDPHDVVEKAHVEHPVGLVEHEVFDMGKVDSAVLDMRDQPARRGDHDIGSHQHALLLLAPPEPVAAAVHDRSRKRQEVGKSLKLDVDLLRELARGHDDQRLDHVVGIALPQQPLEQRERISRRLARSRLGAADQVAPLHNHRYGLFLHGSHPVEIHRPDSFQNIFMKPQFFEFHNLAC